MLLPVVLWSPPLPLLTTLNRTAPSSATQSSQISCPREALAEGSLSLHSSF